MAKKIKSYLYDENYYPAMPIAPVEISLPGKLDDRVSFTALIDCGADGTMIPLHILESVGAELFDRAYLRGVLGHRQSVSLYMVTLHIAGHTIYAVEAVAIDRDDNPILGRDVLNQLEVTLNGPATVTEILA